MAKKWSVKADQASDRKAGIKEGGKRDVALDKKRGVLEKAEMRKAHAAAKRK